MAMTHDSLQRQVQVFMKHGLTGVSAAQHLDILGTCPKFNAQAERKCFVCFACIEVKGFFHWAMKVEPRKKRCRED